ncbi:oxygen sensor protein DosP [mine drainage metagenome]|uniref:Oxygen sensor protein DosP n=1 Tax=mine drainage metagenome TaxID=410659 RepID=A0A1J5PRE9_9ZZZZ
MWPDVAAAELATLAALPGMLACATLRPDVDGVFQIESLAGNAELGALLRSAELAPRLDPAHPAGRGLVAAAWRGARIERSSSYLDDVRTQAWHEALRVQRVRSIVAIPVAADAQRSDMILVLLGAFPRQFDASPMQHFAQGLQRRWRELRASRQRRLPHAVLQQDLAQSYRERLFSGGLEMQVQPIVDLHSGALRKVEALARLRLDDGALVPPGMFLPLLGNAELERLFRLGLEQALAMLREWDTQGLHVELSLNLPPSTLLAADCANWIGDALRAHGVAAPRLTLELLESESVDDASFADAVARLQPLGVRFAMDDLGAGYSSLTRLATLPFDTLKVDQTLAAQLHTRPIDTLRLMSTLIQVGHDTRRCVVIEGLEDEALIEAARVLGAHEGQGYAYARPMPAGALPAWAAQRTVRSQAHTRPRTPLGRLARQLRGRRHGAVDDVALQRLAEEVVAAAPERAGA